MDNMAYPLSIVFFETEVVIAALGFFWINVRAVRGKAPNRPLIGCLFCASGLCGAAAIGLTLHAAGGTGATPAWPPYFALCLLIPGLFAAVLHASAPPSDT